jgi:hypothetical protein
MTGISRRAALRALSFGVTSTLALTAGMALAEGDTV